MMRRTAILLLLLGCGLRAWGQTAPAGGTLAVPNVVLQGQSRAMIHQVFAKEFAKAAPADRVALAKLLLAQARDTKDDATARYVALTDSADIAAGAGDAPTALAAIDEIARQYGVDGLDLRRAALVRAGAAATAQADCEAVMRLALDTADQAVAVDAFEVAQQLANLAEAAAIKTHQVRIVASIQVRLGDLRGLIAEFAQVKAAFTRLERNPADAAAHLTIGRFYALHKGQWALGLPHLALGGDAELAALATRELGRPADGLTQAALGDGWWDYAEKSTGLTRTVVGAHAREWYQAARQTITGITLARIASRLNAGMAGETPRAGAGGAGAGGGGAAAVDMLALIDPAKDGAQGQWSRGAEGLSCDGSAYACLRIPYLPADEYDLCVSFTRTADDGSLALLLAAQKRSFEFVLDIKGEARFEQVGGKIAKDNPTVVPVAVSNGRRYSLTVEVRKTGVRALLDGKAICEYQTDLKDLTRYSVWKLGDNTVCGIGANGAKVTFHTVEMVEVTGKGKATR